MAEIIDCSIPLIYNERLQEAGLNLRDRYSNRRNTDLDSKVTMRQSKLPNAESFVRYNTFY